MKHLPLLFALSVCFIVVFAAASVVAGPPTPTYGTATVDGSANEWNLVNDFYADMYRAGNPTKPVESKLYLRWDCNTTTMYALVLAEPGSPIIAAPLPERNWIAIDDQNNKVVGGLSGNDGTPPDFQFINLSGPTPPDSLTYADGWEGSWSMVDGSYNIIAHAEIFADAKGQTSATTGFPGTGPSLSLDCTVPVEETTWGRIKSMFE